MSPAFAVGLAALRACLVALLLAGPRPGASLLAEDIARVTPPLAQVTTSYTYDNMYRLLSGGTPGSPTTYSYDPAGNRVGETVGAASAAFTYDKADRILTAAGQTYAVDNAGNLTGYPNATLAYDQANRLKTATISGTTTTYAYDGDGKRASKTVGSTTTSYAYDINRSLPVVLTDGTLKYVWGGGLAYATDTSGNVNEVYHPDGLGSTRALTDSTGAIIQTYQTDEFGVPSLTQGTNTQPFRFTGEQRDAESGFVFLRARYYSPSLGRFLTRDTLFGTSVSPLSLHRFVYARDNPVVATDPSGKDCGNLGSPTPPGMCGGSAGGSLTNAPGSRSIPDVLHDAYESLRWLLGGEPDLPPVAGGANAAEDSVLGQILNRNGGSTPILGSVTDSNGNVIAWLEQGGPKAGWQHILENHVETSKGNQFAQYFGAKYDDYGEIRKLILDTAASAGGRSGDYPVPGVPGKNLHVEIGSNGFIVTAYPTD